MLSDFSCSKIGNKLCPVQLAESCFCSKLNWPQFEFALYRLAHYPNETGLFDKSLLFTVKAFYGDHFLSVITLSKSAFLKGKLDFSCKSRGCITLSRLLLLHYLCPNRLALFKITYAYTETGIVYTALVDTFGQGGCHLETSHGKLHPPHSATP